MVRLRFLRCLILAVTLTMLWAAETRADDELYHAVRIGDVESVKELLAAGTDPNSANSAGRYPILAAAERGRLELLRLLLDAGADVAQADSLGRTALFLAVSKNRPEIVALLIERGADLNRQDAGGETPLMAAVRSRNEDITKLLLSEGPDLSIANAQDQRALDIAIALRATSLVALLRSAAPLDAGPVSRAELNQSLQEGRFQRLLQQLSGNIAFDVTGQDGYDFLAAAVQDGALAVARRLIEMGAPVNNAEHGRNGRVAPLISAIRADEGDLARRLIEAGADIEYRYPSEDAYTPLMIAAKNRNADMVRLLIDAGADVNAVTGLGVSAYYIAVNRGNTDIAEELQQAGATPPAYWHDRGAARNRGGLYALEVLIDFDVIRGIKFDPERKTLSLYGENFQPGRRHRIPYIDYLATAYRFNINGFSLDPVPAYEADDERTYNAFMPSPGLFSDYSAYVGSELGVPTGGLVPAREEYFQNYGIPSGNGNWLGMRYRDVWDGVRIWRIAPNAPASNSGLEKGDLIVGLNDIPILSIEALREYVNGRDAGTTVAVRVLRAGRDYSFDVEVKALTSTAGMTQGELLAFVFRGLNEPRKAALVEWLDCGVGTAAPDTAGHGLEAIARCTSQALSRLGIEETGPYQDVQSLLDLSSQELLVPSLRLEVADVSDYEALWSILNRTRMALRRVHVSKFLHTPDEGEYLLENPYRFRDYLRMRQLVYRPDAYRASLLGRSMFEADARLKKTLGMPWDEFEIPGFPINDFRKGFTAYGARRWWIYSDRMSYLENPAHGEIRIDRADIVIGAEDYRQANAADNGAEERSFKSAYSEYHRKVIAENIDDFKKLYPEIHDGFEAVKIVYLGRMLQGKFDLAPYLPAEGQGEWQAPSHWVTRDFGGVSLTGGTENTSQTSGNLSPPPPDTHALQDTAILRSAPGDIRQRLMSGIKAPDKLDPAGSRSVPARGDGVDAPRSSVSVKQMLDAVDYVRSEALNKGVGMVREAAEDTVALFTRTPTSQLEAARTIQSVGEGAAEDVGWVIEDVSDEQQTLNRSNAAPWRAVSRLLPDSWLPDCVKEEKECK